jgi:hypothetical protein
MKTKEIIEEFAKNKYGEGYNTVDIRHAFVDGAEYQAKRMYSEEEVLSLILKFNDDKPGGFDASGWFEQFKKK